MQNFLKLGIIGYPLKHTLSPQLHARLLMAMQLDGEYRPYELPPETLLAQLDELAIRGVRGLNVTIPHKVSVIPWLDWLSPEAEMIGAVNTLVLLENGQHKKGYNTDITGFVRSLPTPITERLPDSNILVLGAGGSARAILAGLIQLNTAEITLAVRDPEKAIPLLSDAEILKQHYQTDTKIHLLPLGSLPALESFQGIINTTPIGMWPNIDDSLLSPIQLETLPAGAFVYDLIYRPLETQLLADARNLGIATFNGLDMLLHQGIAAFELWQENPVPNDLVPALRQDLTQALLQTAP
jgi:shikimate dehydrogenase